MNTNAIIDRISNEKDAQLARNAVEQERNSILNHLLVLEMKLEGEENDLIVIGKQRAYRSVRTFIQR